MDLVFEDVECINNELIKWKQQMIQNKSILNQEKEKTDKLLYPLNEQINDIQQQIKNQKQLILQKKAILLKNEQKTYEIIQKRLLNDY